MPLHYRLSGTRVPTCPRTFPIRRPAESMGSAPRWASDEASGKLEKEWKKRAEEGARRKRDRSSRLIWLGRGRAAHFRRANRPDQTRQELQDFPRGRCPQRGYFPLCTSGALWNAALSLQLARVQAVCAQSEERKLYGTKSYEDERRQCAAVVRRVIAAGRSLRTGVNGVIRVFMIFVGSPTRSWDALMPLLSYGLLRFSG